MSSRDLPPSSLLHPLYGYGAQDIRRAVGSSHAANIAHLEGLVEKARRHLAIHHKHPKGHSVGENRQPVTLDENGHTQFRSLQPDVLVIDGDPNGNPHAATWDIDIEALRPLLEIPEGCECCPENITWIVTTNPLLPLGVVFDIETCTWTLNFPCDPCEPGGPGGG